MTVRRLSKRAEGPSCRCRRRTGANALLQWSIYAYETVWQFFLVEDTRLVAAPESHIFRCLCQLRETRITAITASPATRSRCGTRRRTRAAFSPSVSTTRSRTRRGACGPHFTSRGHWTAILRCARDRLTRRQIHTISEHVIMGSCAKELSYMHLGPLP